MRDRDNIKWLYKITKKQIPKIVLLSLSNAIMAVIGVAVALLSKKIIDEAVGIAVSTNKNYTMLVVFGFVMFAAITVRVMIRILPRVWQFRFRQKWK